MENNFSFEHYLKIDKDLYFKIWNSPLSTDKIKNKFIRKLFFSLFLLSALLFFMSEYTLILGILIYVSIISFLTLSIFQPKLYKFGLGSNYENNELFKYKLKYLINEKGMGVKGQFIDIFCYWNLLHVWQIRGDWLILTPHGMTSLYFQISILKEIGIYDKITDILSKYGIQYNSKHLTKSEDKKL